MPNPASITQTKYGPDAVGTADLSAAIATACLVGGDSFVHTGREVLLIRNASGGSLTVTIKSVANNFGSINTADDIVQSVGAGKIAEFGPFSAARFRDANGLVQITYSAVTTLFNLLQSVPVTG